MDKRVVRCTFSAEAGGGKTFLANLLVKAAEQEGWTCVDTADAGITDVSRAATIAKNSKVLLVECAVTKDV